MVKTFWQYNMWGSISSICRHEQRARIFCKWWLGVKVLPSKDVPNCCLKASSLYIGHWGITAWSSSWTFNGGNPRILSKFCVGVLSYYPPRMLLLIFCVKALHLHYGLCTSGEVEWKCCWANCDRELTGSYCMPKSLLSPSSAVECYYSKLWYNNQHIITFKDTHFCASIISVNELPVMELENTKTQKKSFVLLYFVSL